MSEIKAIEFSLEYRFYSNALMLCEEQFMKNPTAEVFILYIKTYLYMNSPKQASLLCKQNEQLVMKNPRIVILYAQSLYEIGQFSSAELLLKQLENVHALDDEMKTATFYLLGMIRIRIHQREQAQKDFTSALKIQPLMLNAIPYVKNEEKTETSKSYKRTLMTPTQLHSLKSSTRRKSNEGRTNRACSFSSLILKNMLNPIETIKKIPSYFSSSIIALKATGSYYFNCAKYYEAAQIFAKIYQLHPHSIECVDKYSTTLWQLKDEQTLNQVARRAIDLAPSRPEPWVAIGNLFSLQHNSDAAIQMFQRAASIDRSYSYALALAGHEVSDSMDSFTRASEYFRQAIDINPNEWSAWYGLSSVNYKQDNFGAAEYYMKKALNLNPSSSVLYYFYGIILNKSNCRDKAFSMFDKSLELDPNNLLASYHKGVLLFESGDNETAKFYLEKAESISPHEPNISFYRAKIEETLGNYKEAVKFYTDALIYGYTNKKEVNSAIEAISESMISYVLEEDKQTNNE